MFIVVLGQHVSILIEIQPLSTGDRN